MSRIMATTLMAALAGTLTVAIAQQDRDEHRDRGDRHDQDKHGNDKGEHRNNGKHEGWHKQEIRDEHRNWDYDHDRIRPGQHFPYGRYEHVRSAFIAQRIDYRTRRVVLFDNSNWVVASYDLDRCRDWQWQRDNVFVYDDDHHPGWYLLFNARLGRYVHVEYFGVH
jgi:hypothetical protein